MPKDLKASNQEILSFQEIIRALKAKPVNSDKFFEILNMEKGEDCVIVAPQFPFEKLFNKIHAKSIIDENFFKTEVPKACFEELTPYLEVLESLTRQLRENDYTLEDMINECIKSSRFHEYSNDLILLTRKNNITKIVVLELWGSFHTQIIGSAENFIKTKISDATKRKAIDLYGKNNIFIEEWIIPEGDPYLWVQKQVKCLKKRLQLML